MPLLVPPRPEASVHRGGFRWVAEQFASLDDGYGHRFWTPRKGVLVMPTFITIGYGDAAGYNQTDPSVREAAHEHDARLREPGALMGVAGEPVQVRNHDRAGM
jgi:hypothetical protein